MVLLNCTEFHVAAYALQERAALLASLMQQWGHWGAAGGRQQHLVPLQL
jgi:hypothetical protein